MRTKTKFIGLSLLVIALFATYRSTAGPSPASTAASDDAPDQ